MSSSSSSSSDLNGTGTGTGTDNHIGIHLSSDAADRMLEQRLAALSNTSAAIKVTLPPPSSEVLAERLARLSEPSGTVPDEADLQRRFERLHSGTGGVMSSQLLMNPGQLALAGLQPEMSEAEEIDQLVREAQDHARLEREHEAVALSTSMSPPANITANGHTTTTTLASSYTKSTPLPVASTLPPIVSSPPPPTRSEVEELMRELSGLPDTEILSQAHRLSEAHQKRAGRRKKNRDSDSEDDNSDESNDDESEVDRIVRMAQDEARMDL